MLILRDIEVKSVTFVTFQKSGFNELRVESIKDE